MAAHIVSNAHAAQPAAAQSILPEKADAFRQVWRGASGQGYVHTVYSLIGCPPFPRATYILVRRDQRGRRKVLHIGLGQSEAPTLNLARVRQRGAQLGANEVHVHSLAQTDTERSLIACDLRAGQFGSLGSEPARAAG